MLVLSSPKETDKTLSLLKFARKVQLFPFLFGRDWCVCTSLHGQWPGLGNTLHCWYFPSLTRHYHCSVDRGHLPWVQSVYMVQSSIKTYKKEQNCDVCISPPEPRHFFHFVKEFQCNVLLMLLISYSSDLVWEQNCKTKYAAFFAEW